METTKSIEPRMRLSDPVFEDMALSDDTDKKHFIRVCIDTFDQRKMEADADNFSCMAFKDWKVLVSMLLQIGYWDIHDGNAAQQILAITTSDWEFRMGTGVGVQQFDKDEEGNRISGLDIEGIRTLPKGIHRLDCLTWLTINGEEMTSLPLQELKSIFKLKLLDLYGASEVLSDSLSGLPETEKLTRVTTLTLSGVHSLQLLCRCPSVEILELVFDNPGDIDAFLDEVLGSIELEKLRSISFSGSKINGEQLAKFVLEKVPNFPNLELLHLGDCRTTDFQRLSGRLRDGESRAPSTSLKQLQMKLLESTNPDFKKDMLTVLKFFPIIELIDFGYDYQLVERRADDEDLRIDPEFRYALVKNLVGRRILQRGLPLSAWPIVLQRAQCIDGWLFNERMFHLRFGESPGESTDDSPGELGASLAATGIYYLLRKGSALIGRRDLVVDGGGARAACKCPKRKRKNSSTLVPVMKKREIDDNDAPMEK